MSDLSTGFPEIDNLITIAETSDDSATAATVALVHATLELARQQRIANLIAKQAEMFGSLRDGESPSGATMALYTDMEQQILEGLAP